MLDKEQRRELNKTLLTPGWKIIEDHLKTKMDLHISSLVNEDNEQLRGKIHALRDIVRFVKKTN